MAPAGALHVKPDQDALSSCTCYHQYMPVEAGPPGRKASAALSVQVVGQHVADAAEEPEQHDAQVRICLGRPTGRSAAAPATAIPGAGIHSPSLCMLCSAHLGLPAYTEQTVLLRARAARRGPACYLPAHGRRCWDKWMVRRCWKALEIPLLKC